MVSATAPGKVILFGEHAVVYGQPAIAVPVHHVRATATVAPAASGNGLTLAAVNLDQVVNLREADRGNPLAKAARLTLAHLETSAPDVLVTLHSTIPIASGLGSGAAVSTALIRALALYLERPLDAPTVSHLVYEVEKLHHGTPSGIDNTVVAYGLPVYFTRGQDIELFVVGAPLHLVIGDTGVASPTRVAVGDVRRGWEQEPDRYERLFAQVGRVVKRARELVETGRGGTALGQLMNRNQALLRQMNVSSPELERLVAAARAAGALGAKLSGAGRGGNVIALVEPETTTPVAEALCRAGARRVIQTTVTSSEERQS